MTKLTIGNIALIFLLLIVSNLAKADDFVIRCDGCNQTEKKNHAHALAMQSMTNQEKNSFSSNTKIINIIDLKSDTIASFSVTTTRMPSSPVFPWPRWSQNSVLTSPSPAIKSKFDSVIMAKQEFTLSVSSIVIPTTVIENAWEFVGCSYCEGVVQEYIRSQTAADLESFFLSMEALALSIGLAKSPLPNTYELSLESGGKIVIETSIGVGQPPPVLVKIMRVIDASSNEVPSNADELEYRTIYIVDQNSVDIINHYINSFNYYIGSGVVGRVTIQECDYLGSGDSSDEC